MKRSFVCLTHVLFQLDSDLVGRTFAITIGSEQQCLEFVAASPELVG